jgi:hypothetical protein
LHRSGEGKDDRRSFFCRENVGQFNDRLVVKGLEDFRLKCGLFASALWDFDCEFFA